MRPEQAEVVLADEHVELGRVEPLDRLVVHGEVQHREQVAVALVVVDLRPLALRDDVLDVERMPPEALGEGLRGFEVGRDRVDPGEPLGAELSEPRGACDVVRAGARPDAPADAGTLGTGTVIKPEPTTLRVLERRVDRFLPEELELYFDDINDAVERIWDQLDNYKEVVEALESTNESVISHRQNDVLRLLTIISVTMLPLTLITSVFGMNVLFPGETTTAAFWVILGALVATLGAMIGFFRWKGWI